MTSLAERPRAERTELAQTSAPPTTPHVESVHRSPVHEMRKRPRDTIRLVVGEGIDGDAHRGVTVQHRSRVAKDPSQPNLRQVHLVPAELLEELREGGRAVEAGAMGENVVTRGIDLLALRTGSRLRLGNEAVVELTGLRNPCAQLEGVAAGLQGAVLARDERGGLVRRAGVMSVVVVGGDVHPGDSIELHPAPARADPLRPV